MSLASKQLGRPNATKEIVDQLLQSRLTAFAKKPWHDKIAAARANETKIINKANNEIQNIQKELAKTIENCPIKKKESELVQLECKRGLHLTWVADVELNLASDCARNKEFTNLLGPQR